MPQSTELEQQQVIRTVPEEQKKRPIQLTGVEDGQTKFEDFIVGGGTDYKDTIPKFKLDDRGNQRITSLLPGWEGIAAPTGKVKRHAKWECKKLPNGRLEFYFPKETK